MTAFLPAVLDELEYRVGVLTPAGSDELLITASSGRDALLAAESTAGVLRVDTVSAVIDRH